MSAALVALLLAAGPAAPDTAVVCPAEFRQALRPWIEHRQQQGRRIVLISNEPEAEEIRAQIRTAAEGGSLRFVVLVGDAEPVAAFDPAIRGRCVPTFREEAKVNVAWGSEPHIGTDNPYSDLDDDGVPDVAVGRLTADSPGELAVMVRKILAYERSADFGPWRRQMNFVAGIGGFGVLADAALETAARYFLTRGIPAGYQVSMTQASWRSAYCPDPRWFGLTTQKRLSEGCGFWVYIGHGASRVVDRIHVPGANYAILGCDDVPSLDCRRGLPIAVFLACYTGAFDARDDCLAEEMLRSPRAPVAVLAGSRVTMPYGMAVLGTALLDECFVQRRATLGEAVLEAKRRAVRAPEQGQLDRALLDTVAALISPQPDKLADERAEHLLLMNLIGDPLLAIRYPRDVALTVPPEAEPGAALDVTGTSPVDGRATVELVVRRDRLTFDPPVRSEYPTTAGELAAFDEIYQRANDRRLDAAEAAVEGGRFHAKLTVPTSAGGPCHVRVYVEGRGDFALGAANVEVRRPAPESEAGR